MYYGTILEVSGETWLIPGARTKCYKKMRQQMCYGTPSRRQIVHSANQLKNFALKINKDCDGGWRKEVERNYGI